jgi:hypothetical protein
MGNWATAAEANARPRLTERISRRNGCPGRAAAGPPVHGAGLAAHVDLPAVRTALAAAAGLLLAAEGAADLGAGGADVDVGDAAVAAERREEALGGAHVGVKIAELRPCGTSLLHAIASSTSSDRHHVEDRCEGLLLHDRQHRRAAHDRRLHVGAAGLGPAPARLPPTTTSPPCAFGGGDRVVEALGRGLVDQRPDQRLLVERVADAHTAVGLHEAALQLVDHVFVHEQAARRRAALAGGADRAEHDRAHREAEVRVRRAR